MSADIKERVSKNLWNSAFARMLRAMPIHGYIFCGVKTTAL
jgi:hypothetical protein